MKIKYDGNCFKIDFDRDCFSIPVSNIDDAKESFLSSISHSFDVALLDLIKQGSRNDWES